MKGGAFSREERLFEIWSREFSAKNFFLFNHRGSEREKKKSVDSKHLVC